MEKKEKFILCRKCSICSNPCKVYAVQEADVICRKFKLAKLDKPANRG